MCESGRECEVWRGRAERAEAQLAASEPRTGDGMYQVGEYVFLEGTYHPPTRRDIVAAGQATRQGPGVAVLALRGALGETVHALRVARARIVAMGGTDLRGSLVPLLAVATAIEGADGVLAVLGNDTATPMSRPGEPDGGKSAK